MGANSPNTIHVVAEAMKLAFADRSYWLGDPDFTRVPRGLVGKRYAAQLARRIQTDRVSAVTRHGIPPGAAQDFFRQHTTHFSTADAQGNWVACTATLNTSFGSKVIVPGTGVLLNNQMDDFSIMPGVPNFFGLIGGEANSIAPRKRPLTSMSPTIVVRNGKPVLSLGAAGGPTIISQVVLTILNVVDFGLDLETALLQPRFHHQWLPEELRVESKILPEVITELARRGHRTNPVEFIGVTQAVATGTNERGLVGASDSRMEGKAAGL
jgi:gamma-glutamyltranspeptidase/glutathione hydrolase